MCEGNRTLHADAFPTLKQLIIDSTKLIPNPNVDEVAEGLESVYDTWLARVPDKENPSRPMSVATHTIAPQIMF